MEPCLHRTHDRQSRSSSPASSKRLLRIGAVAQSRSEVSDALRGPERSLSRHVDRNESLKLLHFAVGRRHLHSCDHQGVQAETEGSGNRLGTAPHASRLGSCRSSTIPSWNSFIPFPSQVKVNEFMADAAKRSSEGEGALAETEGKDAGECRSRGRNAVMQIAPPDRLRRPAAGGAYGGDGGVLRCHGHDQRSARGR